MNARLKTYCIILAVTYAFILAFSLYEGSKLFIEGVKEGMSSMKHKDSEYFYKSFPYIKLEPKDGYNSFPETKQNLITEKNISGKILTMSVATEDPIHHIPTYLKVMEIVLILFAFILLIGYIYIPFAFFSIIRKVTKGEFMNSKIITKSYIIGSILILSSILDILYSIIQTATVKHVVQFESYNIIYDFGFSTYSAFLLGLVIFIFAETLRMSLKMKEEQDLTI